MMERVCISVPYFLGEKRPERDETDQIRASGYPQKIGADWVEITPRFADYKNRVVAVNAAIAEAIQANVGKFPIIFAADCTSCFGPIKAIDRADVGVVWLDAHGDFNTPETTPSGFLGGMPLAALVGRGNEYLLEDIDLAPIDESQIVITDVRDLDLVEGENLRASAITIAPTIDDLLTVALPAGPIYVHLDVDILDPAHMPALNYPATGGPNPAQVKTGLHRIAQDGNVVALLVSLWNADRAQDDGPMQTTLDLVDSFLEAMEAR